MCPSQEERGFTLVELMVVVLIIGILSALAAPEISEAMMNRRMTAAGVRVMAIYRGARARALGRGLAQMVRYTQIGNSATVEHWEGNSNSCAASDWATIVTTRAAAPTFRRMLVDEENFSTVGTDWERSGIVLNRLNVTGNLAGGSIAPQVDLCFTPLGRLFYRSGGAGPFLDVPNGETGYQLRIERLDLGTGSKVGVARYVVVPTSGTPRLQLMRDP